jgi:23S rRNA U2552 (ribose-2'-O)-methylase RlmE/FtsJ
MIELWKLFKFDEIRSNCVLPSINTFHLAEGPGGFIEATSHIRKNPDDIYYGMTLINDDPGCPGWKKSNTFLDNNPNVKIIRGEDGTGDLLNIENYKYCKDRYLNSMDIITADGGIDVSIDFNKQEKLVSKLIISEVIYAVTMQKKGGHFILKIFDIFSKLTVDLLYILSSIYAEVYITKPYTSRLANSEKYIICKKFLLDSSLKLADTFVEEFAKLNDVKPVASILNIEHDYYFLNKGLFYNYMQVDRSYKMVYHA